MTRATEPAAAVIIAGRPPRTDMVRASTTEATRLTMGSTPATMEKEMTSGTRASVVTSPASTSRDSSRGERRTAATVMGSKARAFNVGVVTVSSKDKVQLRQEADAP